MLRSHYRRSIFLLVLITAGCSGGGSFPDLRGPYLGQTPPGGQPELFAPGIISTGRYDRDIAMTPDGREIYFTVIVGNYDLCVLAVTREQDGGWTEPELLPFAADPDYMSIEPFVSPDGRRFFFVSNRPLGEGREDENIWVAERVGEGWGDPVPLPAPVNTEDGEFFPSLTRDGTLYFTRGIRSGPGAGNFIYRARPTADGWAEPERLPAQVNPGAAQYNAFIDPDERYLIVPMAGRPDSRGGTDYYICFRGPDDTWTGPINLGPEVNSAANLEWSPYVSPDGRYFFFMSIRMEPPLDRDGKVTYQALQQALTRPGFGLPDTYWVDASFLLRLRPGP
jgi:hypothetical protein